MTVGDVDKARCGGFLMEDGNEVVLIVFGCAFQ